MRGYANTYFHEVGHCMDDVSDLNDYTSNDMDYDFIETLREDYENYVSKVQEEQGLTTEQAKEWIGAWLEEEADMKNGISDLLKGLSNSEVKGKWSHADEYYNDTSIEREAFAHFFEAGMSYKPQKMIYILEVFPKSYKMFNEMLEDELS
ncbi:MAG: hypothetical protein IJF37_00870 [Lachnospiraceae bacterium]|nr:hypothetical protein [Lachnospiraceae bacterium]